MRTHPALLLSVSLLSLASGCATLHPRAIGEHVKFEPFGESNDVRAAKKSYDKQLAAAIENIEPDDIADLNPEVKIFERTLPDGVTLKDGVVTASPESAFDVVGTFSFTTPVRETQFMMASVWFSDYASVGRKALCYPQVPLTWLTLGMWPVFSPTAYPCVARAPTQDELYGVIRTSAKSAGASVVVIGGTAKYSDTIYMMSGFFLKARNASTPAAQPRSARRGPTGTTFEFLSASTSYPYFGNAGGGGCKTGSTYVRAKLKTAFDGLEAGVEVMLRLERTTLASSRVGDTFVLSQPQRAGTGKDGTRVYCHSGAPATGSADEMVYAAPTSCTDSAT